MNVKVFILLFSSSLCLRYAFPFEAQGFLTQPCKDCSKFLFAIIFIFTLYFFWWVGKGVSMGLHHANVINVHDRPAIPN